MWSATACSWPTTPSAAVRRSSGGIQVALLREGVGGVVDGRGLASAALRERPIHLALCQSRSRFVTFDPQHDQAALSPLTSRRWRTDARDSHAASRGSVLICAQTTAARNGRASRHPCAVVRADLVCSGDCVAIWSLRTLCPPFSVHTRHRAQGPTARANNGSSSRTRGTHRPRKKTMSERPSPSSRRAVLALRHGGVAASRGWLSKQAGHGVRTAVLVSLTTAECTPSRFMRVRTLCSSGKMTQPQSLAASRSQR